MDIVGYAATLLTIGAFVPQTYKVIRTRKTRDLSLPTYIAIFIAGILWTAYGISIDNPSLIVTNSIVGILALVICVLKVAEG